MQAMIFAAGLGTRLHPLTLTKPKALVEVGGRPMLWHVLMRLRDEGFDDIVINVHHFPSQITDYLSANDNFGLAIRISDESSMLLDTGGAIRHAFPSTPTCPVLIHNVDIFSNAHLSTLYQSATNEIVGAGRISAQAATLLVSERPTSRYLLFDDHMSLVGWTNIKTGEVKSPYPTLNPTDYKHLAFSGIHVISPTLIGEMSSWPDKFSIIDFYLAHCSQYTIKGHIQPDLHLTDAGKPETLRQLNTPTDNR